MQKWAIPNVWNSFYALNYLGEIYLLNIQVLRRAVVWDTLYRVRHGLVITHSNITRNDVCHERCSLHFSNPTLTPGCVPYVAYNSSWDSLSSHASWHFTRFVSCKPLASLVCVFLHAYGGELMYRIKESRTRRWTNFRVRSGLEPAT